MTTSYFGKIIIKVALFLLLCLAVLELIVRISGITNYPIYIRDEMIGYYLAPNQSGTFLHMNEWSYNEQSMSSKKPFEPSEDSLDVLLIGDSVVYGGNPVDFKDQLGTIIDRKFSGNIWTVAAGSWSLQNALAYIRRFKNVTDHLDGIIFVVNNGDFGEPSWIKSEIQHPTRKALWQTGYTLDRYVFGNKFHRFNNESYVKRRDIYQDFQLLCSTFPGFIHMWIYPDVQSVNRMNNLTENFEGFTPGEQIGLVFKDFFDQCGLRVFSVLRHADWGQSNYRDTIHPNVKGNKELAQIILEEINN